MLANEVEIFAPKVCSFLELSFAHQTILGGNLGLDKALENDEVVPSSWCQWRDSHACVTSN